MKNLLNFVFCLLTFVVVGQTPTEQAQPFVDEGIRLYKSEMASWYGTDLFLEKYENRSNIGGYFSYVEKEIAKCIFFSREESPQVIGTISFDEDYDVATADVDIKERKFSTVELDLFSIRQRAIETINTDTLFVFYENTNFNIIPLIHEGKRKVYILTGPQNNGIVIFGNDYLITFDEENNITEKKQLHKNIIPIEYGHNEEGQEIVSSMHSHTEETGDFITATDVCTLMLYGKFTGWKHHTILSDKYWNMWDCENNTLLVMTKEAMDKIDKHQEELKKEREEGSKKKEKKKKRKRN